MILGVSPIWGQVSIFGDLPQGWSANWQNAKNHDLSPSWRNAKNRDLSPSWRSSLAGTNPALYTTRFPKRGREQKILIDYLRNNRTNTSVAAFSARARAEATVSTPVSWRQLTARLSPGTYTVIGWRTLAGPRDPWHDYWTTRQTISAAAFRAITELRPST